MRPLETKFTHASFSYDQVKREGDWACFGQSKGGRVVSYEVVKIQQRPAEKIHGRDYPARETYRALKPGAPWMDNREARRGSRTASPDGRI